VSREPGCDDGRCCRRDCYVCEGLRAIGDGSVLAGGYQLEAVLRVVRNLQARVEQLETAEREKELGRADRG